MNLKIIEQEPDRDLITLRLETTIFGAPVFAGLSGRYRYAVIDGLLWWLLGAQVAAYRLRIERDFNAWAVAEILHATDVIEDYMRTIRWHEVDDLRARIAANTIAANLDHIAPTAEMNETIREAHADIVTIADIIQARAKKFGDLDAGMEGIFVALRTVAA